jgi:hypothetical protein
VWVRYGWCGVGGLCDESIHIPTAKVWPWKLITMPELGSAREERSGIAFLPLHPRVEYLDKKLENLREKNTERENKDKI